ncbi:uncharacterized protein GLRG_01848 [Colletotrichum graminicola M1.001]|uniref:Uncharacterized protein n=1 Tax=Colletotrichum graminicola (strain M1.001 / M2 / FGSC 10212) TaxID=645133 RepID=E3Q9H4_COLGM|nr:uncharacterized protein GLRG_01848 [Colletotrichum graminicola M1.001]EFQ27353.1 hypothetical protein GLRG_01848 [Colletotrichum graminicola M1.001]
MLRAAQKGLQHRHVICRGVVFLSYVVSVELAKDDFGGQSLVAGSGVALELGWDDIVDIVMLDGVSSGVGTDSCGYAIKAQRRQTVTENPGEVAVGGGTYPGKQEPSRKLLVDYVPAPAGTYFGRYEKDHHY